MSGKPLQHSSSSSSARGSPGVMAMREINRIHKDNSRGRFVEICRCVCRYWTRILNSHRERYLPNWILQETQAQTEIRVTGNTFGDGARSTRRDNGGH
ncbi:protein NLRC5 [Anopheles sinensis]|uniref:Protein NLRC5 n=1 Tax=Anopheles sinensis TaxID=74873 RepID=A0A084WJA9_ANOSI|nr:protein NLRC5 [Anopheles sinensis]